MRDYPRLQIPVYDQGLERMVDTHALPLLRLENTDRNIPVIFNIILRLPKCTDQKDGKKFW
jgi:hypothetical protein